MLLLPPVKLLQQITEQIKFSLAKFDCMFADFEYMRKLFLTFMFLCMPLTNSDFTPSMLYLYVPFLPFYLQFTYRVLYMLYL